MDHITSERRSWLMARVRGKDTSAELKVRRAVHAMGFRFRIHREDLPGTPDLALPKHRLIILVHGCFWHRHSGCKKATFPKTRMEFWEDKFNMNVSRDLRVRHNLETLGWRVEIVWECETANQDRLANRLFEIFHMGEV